MKFFWKICIALTVLIAILILLGGGAGVFIVITNIEEDHESATMDIDLTGVTFPKHPCVKIKHDANTECETCRANAKLDCMNNSTQDGRFQNCIHAVNETQKNCTNEEKNVNITRNCTDFANEAVWNCTQLGQNITQQCEAVANLLECRITCEKMGNVAYTNCTQGFDDKTKHCVLVNNYLNKKVKQCENDSITAVNNKCLRGGSFEDLDTKIKATVSEAEYRKMKECSSDVGSKFITDCSKKSFDKPDETIGLEYCDHFKKEETVKCRESVERCKELVEKKNIECLRKVHHVLVDGKQCYYDIHNFKSKWCGHDLTHYKQDEKLNTSNPSTDDLCLDMVTPLAIQPICNTTETIADCEREAGQCYEGRCCPKLKKRDQDQFALYNLPFKTNVSCDPYSPLPLIFSFAFCNTNDRKVWTIGHKDRAGASVRTNLRFCSDNTECEKEFVCVNLIQGKRMCYFDPAYEVGLDYIAAVGYFFPLFFVLVALITCFVLAVYKL